MVGKKLPRTRGLEPAWGVIDGLVPHGRLGQDEDLAALASAHVLEVPLSAPDANDVLDEHLLGSTGILHPKHAFA